MSMLCKVQILAMYYALLSRTEILWPYVHMGIREVFYYLSYLRNKQACASASEKQKRCITRKKCVDKAEKVRRGCIYILLLLTSLR